MKRVRLSVVNVNSRSRKEGDSCGGSCHLERRAQDRYEQSAGQLYSAVQDRSVHFHILDTSTKQPIKQRMVDPENDQEVAKEEIQRGLELEPGTFVVIDEDELARMEPKASRDIEIKRFVPPARINHQWYERPYYLGPDGDESAYFALTKALKGNDREGVARWVMREKQYIGALNVKDGYLVL